MTLNSSLGGRERTHNIHIVGLTADTGFSDTAAISTSKIPCISRGTEATGFGAYINPSFVEDWTADRNGGANLQQLLVKHSQ